MNPFYQKELLLDDEMNIQYSDSKYNIIKYGLGFGDERRLEQAILDKLKIHLIMSKNIERIKIVGE
jgi:hypothetical protein